MHTYTPREDEQCTMMTLLLLLPVLLTLLFIGGSSQIIFSSFRFIAENIIGSRHIHHALCRLGIRVLVLFECVRARERERESEGER
jgi:hypothetical protein